ncbi:MAG: tape measure protein, partial [Acidobacteria bacterium]|nr:tape measure protein [Acidobacteriota bacterium]
MADVIITTRLDDQVSLQLSKITGDVGKLGSEVEKLGSKSGKVNTLTESFKDLKRALIGLGVLKIGREFLELSDAFETIQAQLRLSTKNVDELNTAYKALFAQAQKAGTPFEAQVKLFQDLTLRTDELGLSQQNLLKITDAVSKAIALSNQSAEATKGALIQFGQLLSGASTNAEELNSILDQAPPLAKLLADGLRINVSELKEFAKKSGEAGTLQRDLIKAILGNEEALKKLNEAFAKVGQTSSKELERLRNALINLQPAFKPVKDAWNELIDSMAKGIERITPLLIESSKKQKAWLDFILKLSEEGRKAIKDKFLDISDYLETTSAGFIVRGLRS